MLRNTQCSSDYNYDGTGSGNNLVVLSYGIVELLGVTMMIAAVCGSDDGDGGGNR